jgi:hypothetical protein
MYIQNVLKLAYQFMKKPQFVYVDDIAINEFAKQMKKTVPLKFNKTEPFESETLEVLTHLLASSINYCFWYGRYDIRPNDASSTKMYGIVEDCVKHLREDHLDSNTQRLKNIVRIIICRLSEEKFPLIEERSRHLKEIIRTGYKFSEYIVNNHSDDFDTLNNHFGMIIRSYPGFASDMFLKRASLFFLMLYRTFGWYADGMKQIHIPADYQVPKLMHFFDLISYTRELQRMIDENKLIEKYSLMECEIRAATIVTNHKLSQLTGWNTSDIDGWFWLRRKECASPFHLTITTDY